MNRNYSFVYDQNLDRYDFFYNNEDPDDYESVSQGYWGYLRDVKADRKLNNTNNASTGNHDGYWGVFQDFHADSSYDTNVKTPPSTSKKPHVKFAIAGLSDVELDSESSSSTNTISKRT